MKDEKTNLNSYNDFYKDDTETKDEIIKNIDEENFINENSKTKKTGEHLIEDKVEISSLKNSDKNKKNSSFAGKTFDFNVLPFASVFIAFFIVLIPFVYTSHSINNEIVKNTIMTQSSIQSVIHNIASFELTTNENHLILLQSELTKLEVLLEQTEKLDGFLLQNNHSNARNNYLLTKVKENIYFLEESLAGNMQFNPNYIFQFKEELNVISSHFEKKPVTTYDEFVRETDRLISNIKNNW